MKLLTLAAISGTALLAAGCVIIDADSDGYSSHYASHDDRVYSADVSGDTVTVRVPSNGCTDKSYFKVDVDREDHNTFYVEFEREREDHCRGLMPEGVELVYSFSELGIPAGASVVIENPVGR
ncbi:hypothetical protein [Ponticaulis sp.]|uniref:hypothetical protein n=1 Tax=Ponticaulis sp. TaxID=2020902 RepID=UPI000B6803FA|nr:hypothetical protein [Ponticaulis sp.]MAJ08831.1 hypothetical protein [Ponticaulis sp.]RPG17524.1 MAG: hypothetical protein CBC85_006080 [Hyphomonadaceae bacterium TMED125]HBH89350.1 hypothetical protein [Hyphomonadaceae bacterium]HBJ91664.1 hypothetical protein [Hyphomonadaceae bacterium]|tara:strand:+ start:3149 stop:3517 length:369 start_codon:yes stop_codon:yes gene_type:complete